MTYPDILDYPILSLTDSICLSLRDFVEGGTLVIGGLGSGKSSTSLRSIAYGFLRAGMGGLVLTVKSDETQHWIEYARACGREKDLIVFSPEGDLTFDPLAYSWAQSGRAGGHLETIIELFGNLLAVGKHYGASSGERYFEQAVEELMRTALVLLSLGNEQISIISIHNIIASLPVDTAQIEDAEWQESSPCAKLIYKIRERKDTLSHSQWADLDNAVLFATKKWPDLDPRTKGNIESTWSGMASKFLYDPFRSRFCSGTFSFTPEQVTHEKKIIILDMPILDVGKDASRLSQILIKLVFQRAWLRHQYVAGCCNGAFLFQDEFQMVMSRFEHHFVQVCRSSAIAVVCATQSILNLSEEMGEEQPGSKTKSFLNNLSIKIAHRTICPDSAAYLSSVLGTEYRYIESFNSGSGTHSNTTFGGSLQLVPIVQPGEFSRLAKPNGQSPYAAAIVFCGGTIFNSTKSEQNPAGRNYLTVYFSRE